MKKLTIISVILILLISQHLSFSQQDLPAGQSRKAKIDSLMDTYSIEDILKYREYYQQQIDELRAEKLK